MAHVFMPRIFEPPVPTPVVVTITGSGSDAAYTTINGTTYNSAANAEVMPGDVIAFQIKSLKSGKFAEIIIDGTIFVSTKSTSLQSYEWTVPSGIEGIAIAFAQSSSAGTNTITVTTS